MRALIGAVAVVVLSGAFAAADEKIDAKKLVGKWEELKPKKGKGMLMEFTKDGKIVIVAEGDGETLKIEGTYKVDGNKLTMMAKVKEMDVKQSVTITKLTDDLLEGEADSNKESKSFKRVKDKK